jgi:pyruvate dehydrogenase E1 component beta subunit
MLTSLFVGIPGIKVVAPSTAAQAKGLLKSAIRDPNPVLVVENKRLYPQRGEVPTSPDFVLPLEKAVVACPGEAVSLFAYSAMVPLCLAVQRAFAAQGVSIEVVDLVSLQPLDRDTIIASVRKTGRAICVEEGCVTGGVGAEVAAVIAESCMDCLEAPIARVGAKDVPIPASTELEKIVLPSAEDVVEAVQKTLSW